jgi:5'-nucleotidase
MHTGDKLRLGKINASFASPLDLHYLCSQFIDNMDNQRPLILITNDDGVEAKGIRCLTTALHDLGDIFVMAPDGPRSGMGSAITSLNPIRYEELYKSDSMTICSCTGTPTDCIKLAINTVLDRKPDLVVAGINHGGNMAICVHYSGTMGAVAEGCIFGVPSLGVSLLDHHSDADFDECCRLGRKIAERILKEGLPHGVFLNLNLPITTKVKGLKICRQAAGRFVEEFVTSKDGQGKTVFWLTGHFQSDEPILPDNDMNMLHEGYASLVPCKIDLTDYELMDKLQDWGE